MVRRPAAGESIQTLDGQEREITSEMLAICDGAKPVAVAGVMGGHNSEITDTTKTVVFESACFNGPMVRITAKALGMRTEASGRFEKGLDPSLTMPALLRACALVEQLGAGEVVNGTIDVCSADQTPKTLPFDFKEINHLLGIHLTEQEQIAYLERLSFQVKDGVITIPSFRVDIHRMCDIAEEVARMYGYDNIPTTLYAGEMVQGEYTPKQQLERHACNICRMAGFDESMSHSFISPKFYDAINLPENDIRRISTTILNPLGEDFSIMRTTVLPSMLQNLSHNHAHRNASVSLFEMGTIYIPQTAEGKANPEILPREEKILTLGTYGRMDFFEFKGVVEVILRELNVQDVSFTPEKENPSYHPGRCARIYAGQTLLGVFGAVHPLVCKKYGIESEVLTAELAMDVMFDTCDDTKCYQPLPKFPASTRDIAVLCDDAIPVVSLEKAIRNAVGAILEQVTLFDVYKGNQIPAGKKSVAYSMSLRAADRTLTDEECDRAMKKAITALENEFHATLRG